jgi:hypothetical protein
MAPGTQVKHFECEVRGDIHVTEIFNALVIKTEDGHQFGLCQRDSGLEIHCPDGTLVGIKICDRDEMLARESAAGPSFLDKKKGDTFIERNCEVVG